MRLKHRNRLLAAVIASATFTTVGCSSPAERTDAQPAAGAPAANAPAKPAPQTAAGPPPSASAADVKETRTGLATFIAERFNGRKTASGEPYDSKRLVAAHPSYPLGTTVRVTNPENGRAVEVKIIDRSAGGAQRPIVDLSRAAAERLDIVRRGTATVTVDVIEWGPKAPK